MAKFMSVAAAAAKYGLTRPAIYTAIKRGRITVELYPVEQLRVHTKSLLEWSKTLDRKWQESGRRGGLTRAKNARERRAREAESARASRSA